MCVLIKDGEGEGKDLMRMCEDYENHLERMGKQHLMRNPRGGYVQQSNGNKHKHKCGVCNNKYKCYTYMCKTQGGEACPKCLDGEKGRVEVQGLQEVVLNQE